MQEYTTNAAEMPAVNPDMVGKWLTFWLDGQLFGTSIELVEQIVSMMPITEVPEYPYYTKGIINIRGAIVPLIDLRLRLGRQETKYTDQTCIIICRIGEDLIGFIADAVDAVQTISAEQISAPPQIGEEITNRYLLGIARIPDEAGAGEKLILCMDTVKVLLHMEQSEE